VEAPFIPRRTRAEIQNPAPPGQRHRQAIRIALSLIGQGLSPEAVFMELRGKYPEDVLDHEIHGVIDWVLSKNPQPCAYGASIRNRGAQKLFSPTSPLRTTPAEAVANAQQWLGNFRCDECDLWHASPWRPPEDWHKDALMLIAGLYNKDDLINIVIDFTVEKQKDGKEKANPQGAGKTLLRDEWLRRIRDCRAPEDEAGCWIRMNPVKAKRGSGRGGTHTDADVAAFRFLLLESDDLPIESQLSLWSCLPLPVVAIVASGGRSVHGWVKVDCKDAAEYEAIALRIYERLARFGLCLNNRNPSRLARLPGVKRKIGGIGMGEQRLLYLHDSPSERPIFKRRNLCQ
jgi:hypothetical protein